MNKLRRKAVYEAPRTDRFVVEMEGGFMAGSADFESQNKTTGNIGTHDVNGDFSAVFEQDFGGTSNWE